MSTTRSLRNRSSRYSSPATFAGNPPPTKIVESQRDSNGGQRSLDKWMEPTVRSAVPSFEDTKGLERVGVLEHMAPLGVAPSQKLLQKLKVNLNRHSPRVAPVNVEGVTPPNEPVKADILSPVDTEPLPESHKVLQERMVISSPPRGRPAKKELDEMRQIVDVTTPSPVKAAFQSAQSTPRPQSIQEFIRSERPQSIQEIIRQDRMKNVFERAIAEANSHSSPSLVPGLQQLLEDARSNPQVWAILDAVLNRTPTDAQFKVFKRYIKRGKRYYHRHSTNHQDFTQTANSTASLQSQPAGYIHTFPTHLTSTGLALPGGHSNDSPFRFKPVHAPAMPQVQNSAASSPKDPLHFVESTNQSSPDRKRSRSASSSSSLSSAKSLPEEFSPEAIDVDEENQAAEGRSIRSTNQRQATNQVAAAASRTRSTVLPQSESPQRHEEFPTTNQFAKRKLKGLNSQKDEASSDPEQVESRRRAFEEESFIGYNNINRPESSDRTIVEGRPMVETASHTHVPPPVLHPNPLFPSNTAFASPAEVQTKTKLHQINGTSRKRPYDEIDRTELDIITPRSSSPSSAAVQAPPESKDIATMLLGPAPKTEDMFPSAYKSRKSARVMVSPNKPKNGGITAGISRAGPGRDVAIGNGAESGLEDNDEFCASCGGEGTLLCCDGCTNSFHHGCLEPPIDPEDEFEGEWFCPRCVARRHREPLQIRGLMGQIIRRVDHMIPKAFALPFDIRDYFEGVKTGDEGEYEEIGLPRTQNTAAKMNRAGFFEEPSYKELRDSKGNFILCYRCGKASNGRDIIPCDYCPAKWHTDCIDPPLAVPPRRRGGDKPTGYWRCPLHVDGDLAEIGRQANAAPGDLGRMPRLRKPKKAIPIDVDLSRGFRNNGVIEVDLMKDDTPDIREVSLESGIYRLPERGIQLDFIDRVKKAYYEDKVFPYQLNTSQSFRDRFYRPDDPVLHHPASYTVVDHKELEYIKEAKAISVAEAARANVQLRQRSFREQSAVMDLLSLANQESTSYSGHHHKSKDKKKNYSIDPLADLTNALVASAPEAVESAVVESERDTLLRLQHLISSRLQILGGDKPEQEQVTKSAPAPYSGKATLSPKHGCSNGDIDQGQLNGDTKQDVNGQENVEEHIKGESEANPDSAMNL